MISPQDLNRQGMGLSQKGKLDKAIMAFNTALEMEPGNPLYLYNLALVFQKKGDWITAKELLEKVIHYSPTWDDALVDLGLCHYNLADHKTAESFYKQALEENPLHSRGWNNLGVIFFLAEEYLKAQEAFQTAVNIDPEYTDGWYNLRDCHEVLGHTKEARIADKKWKELQA